jgi:hypothetical protein
MNIFEKKGTRKNTKISFRTDDETLAQLKSLCRIENRTISSLIENILTEHVLIHENNSPAEQEKRLSPRKKCSIPAVIFTDKNEKRIYYNCLIKSLSTNSAQLMIKNIFPEEKFQKEFYILFNLPKCKLPLLLPCQLIRSNCLEKECLLISKFVFNNSTDSKLLLKYLQKNDFLETNDKKKSLLSNNQ